MIEKNKATKSPLDSVTLAKLHDALGQNIDIVLEHFINYAPTQIDALSTAVANDDMVFLARKAHQMKGECCQIGALVLANLCQEMEQTMRESKKQQLICLKKIQAEMDKVLLALKDEIQKNDLFFK
jgi:HPt (histidine-containing phosphotransfer) domain-containing protein